MKEIEVTIGWKVLDDNDNVVGFKCDYTDNGKCYKDMETFDECDDSTPIYISESAFDDTDFISIEDAERSGWYFGEWLNFVADVVRDSECTQDFDDETKNNIIITLHQIVYEICDYQNLDIFLEGYDWEDCVEEMVEELSK